MSIIAQITQAMPLKVKLIICIVVLVTIVTSVISLFIYINYLNNKITDLNTVIINQSVQIDSLNYQVNSLELNVASFKETIAITNDYLNSVEASRIDEMNTKQSIYETITTDKNANDWYNSEIPQSLLNSLMRNIDDATCYE